VKKALFSLDKHSILFSKALTICLIFPRENLCYFLSGKQYVLFLSEKLSILLTHCQTHYLIFLRTNTLSNFSLDKQSYFLEANTILLYKDKHSVLFSKGTSTQSYIHSGKESSFFSKQTLSYFHKDKHLMLFSLEQTPYAIFAAV
jgi:hypothetical protein